MLFISDETLHAWHPAKIYHALQTDPWCSVQSISSAVTDTNRMEEPNPLLMQNTGGVNAFADLHFKKNTIVLDVGGGGYDFNTTYMQKTHGVALLVWDPYNRPEIHNKKIQCQVQEHAVDAATSMSVLNVVPDLKARLHHIHLIFKALMVDGIAYFKIWPGEYELKGSSLAIATKEKYQANAYAQRFLFEIQAIFGLQQVKVHPKIPNLIVAIKKRTSLPRFFELLTILDRSRLFHIALRRKQEARLDAINCNQLHRALKFGFFQVPRLTQRIKYPQKHKGASVVPFPLS